MKADVTLYTTCNDWELGVREAHQMFLNDEDMTENPTTRQTWKGAYIAKNMQLT